MKLLILTQYFPPETGAPQNRLFELALQLKNKNVDVEVLTAMPNYPKMEVFKEYEGKKKMVEMIEGLKIYRSNIYVTKSKGIFKRLLNYFSFVFSAYSLGKKLGNYDYILCESPPLFLGYTAMRLSRKLSAKLIFNVSDLWPESAEKMGLVSNKFFLKLAYNLEAKIYKNSYLITGQTQGIVKSIKTRFPDRDVFWLPNGVDLNRYQPTQISSVGFREKYQIPSNHLLFFYGGILGHAQGLEVIIKAAEKLKNREISFVLMGSGPQKDELLRLKKTLNCNNVIFADAVGRTEIAGIIKDIDVSIVPLRNLELFKGAIPSKIFEILAMEKPILLGVNGEAKELFIDQGNCGWYFEPENVDDLVSQINTILNQKSEVVAKGKNGRNYVSANFNRSTIVEEFYQYLLKKETKN
ncbi:glycosyltransferase family 4 protein [Crocinitomix algicola]|uniref:glycosyltransferase family 4 protein n=1 Tax=Crocinitomix algicola TaxID=1740263 RepID=UPI000871F69F|nr:glycosyltransferase family 4 protein [Crocinitomix algicola]